MKLNKKKNIILTQKALAVKELEYYAKLCQTYARLAKTQENISSPSEIESRYSLPLAYATRGDLSMLTRNESTFSPEEVKLIKQYSFLAKRQQQFSEASAKLKSALPSKNDYIDWDKLQEYKDFMQTESPSTQKFDEFISIHSPIFIGHEYYTRVEDAVEIIESVDSNHIPNKFKNFTSQSFGANIRGCRIKISDIVKHAENIFTDRDADQYEADLSFGESVREVAIMATNKMQKFYANHEKGVKAAILAGAIALGTLGVGNTIVDFAQKSSQTLTENTENGYNTDYSDDFKKSILNFQNLAKMNLEDPIIRKSLISSAKDLVDNFFLETGENVCEDKGLTFAVEEGVFRTSNYDKTDGTIESMTITGIDENGEKKDIHSTFIFDNYASIIRLEQKLDDNDLSIEETIELVNKINETAGRKTHVSRLGFIYTTASEKINELEKDNNSSLFIDKTNDNHENVDKSDER